MKYKPHDEGVKIWKFDWLQSD